jgi:hypothetical protein
MRLPSSHLSPPLGAVIRSSAEKTSVAVKSAIKGKKSFFIFPLRFYRIPNINIGPTPGGVKFRP